MPVNANVKVKDNEMKKVKEVKEEISHAKRGNGERERSG